jgi:dTDP-4-amino-4,6-dideoxygalactose transaminase
MNPLGTLGDCGIISFGYSKPIAMGIGAAIIVNNTDLLEKLHYVAVSNNRSKVFSLDTMKHNISLRLALKEHNKLLRFLATYFHLYDFNASPEFYKNIPSQWQLFEKNIPALKCQLFELSDLIAHDKIKKLDYRGRDWLPWRYSFHIEDDIFLRKFRRIGKENHIKVSRLYKPIVKHFDNDENCARKYPKASNWSKTVVNLVYNHTLEDVAIIKKNINHVITSTAEALE